MFLRTPYTEKNLIDVIQEVTAKCHLLMQKQPEQFLRDC